MSDGQVFLICLAMVVCACLISEGLGGGKR